MLVTLEPRFMSAWMQNLCRLIGSLGPQESPRLSGARFPGLKKPVSAGESRDPEWAGACWEPSALEVNQYLCGQGQ